MINCNVCSVYVQFQRCPFLHSLTFKNLISLWMSQYSEVSSRLTFKKEKHGNTMSDISYVIKTQQISLTIK